jgi:hypothetical protein
MSTFYISWRHPWNYILNSKGDLMARSRLSIGWSFFQHDKIVIEFENESLMKHSLGGIVSIFVEQVKIIKQDNLEVIRYSPIKSRPESYKVVFQSNKIEFIKHSDSVSYQILLDDSPCGHIKHDLTINCPIPVKHIGTEIEVPNNIARPCILFAILSKDYFGPAT